MNTAAFALTPILFLFIGFSIPISWEWIYYPWLRPYRKITYRPGPNSSNHLNALIHVLCEVHSWLGPGNNPITQGLQKELWEQVNYLKIEQYACTAIFSPKSNERIWAIRRLSENKSRRVQAVIYAISEHNGTSDEIRTIAKEILRKENYEHPGKTKPKSNAGNNKGHKSANHDNSDSPFVYSENTIINMKDGAMVKKDGDTYNVGQAGAVGPHSQADHVYMSQGSTPSYDELDLEKLCQELEILRLELKKQAKTSEHDIAIGAIASAEIEVKRGDRSKAKEYLKQAGMWAFDVATKIGVGVAIAALKYALGI
jgi:hypothetical protein